MKQHRVLKVIVQPVIIVTDNEDPDVLKDIALPTREIRLHQLADLAAGLQADMARLDEAAAEQSTQDPSPSPDPHHPWPL